MPAHVDVELDIFSGTPNPTWALTSGEADGFMRQLAAKAPSSATQLSGSLGYRGFIVQVTQGDQTQLIHIQAGTIHIATGATTVYTSDSKRELERWLLMTGKPHLKNDLFQIVDGQIP